MPYRVHKWSAILLMSALLALLSYAHAADTAQVKILNGSYDVTREFYQDFDDAFAKYWQDKTSNIVTITQSHGGSTKQALSVLNGLLVIIPNPKTSGNGATAIWPRGDMR